MFNLDDITNENCKEHSERWPIILNHPCRILIIGESGSAKTNALLNLISHQDDIDKIHLHAKDLSEPKYQFLIKKREDAGVKHSNYSNYSTGCSNTMDDVYKNIDDYNPNRKRRISAFFSDKLKKYEYLTSEDLRYKPSALEKSKFEYSPLGEVLIRDCMKMIKKKDF